MQGYILNITKSVREDLFVKILTNHAYYTLYRFYGKRHSIIHAGRKIDFEIEESGIYIPKLRNILHLMQHYETSLQKVYIWQRFCSILDFHLNDINEVNPFYFNQVDSAAKILHRQDAKRVVLNLALNILDYEGRLYLNEKCHICNTKFNSSVALTHSFLLACPRCIINPCILDFQKIQEAFKIKSFINFSDNEIIKIYEILLFGL